LPLERKTASEEKAEESLGAKIERGRKERSRRK
jgi:hypothetical protein